MQQVIEITAPFFGLIFLGTFLKSIKFLNEERTTPTNYLKAVSLKSTFQQS